MSSKPEKLEEIWGEKELAERLGLPVRKSGRCIPLSFWVRGGLPVAEKAGKRYFFEADVINYLWGRREGSESAE